MDQVLEKLVGSIERVTFRNPETGYTILRVKARGQKDPVMVVGYHEELSAGEMIELLGSWSVHLKYGLQFQAQTIEAILPTTPEGIERYLGSGLIKGIGPHIAKQLVHAFGLKVFDVLETQPEALLRLKGIGRVRVEMITKAWKELRAVRDILIFLQSHGVTTNKAVRIYRKYGKEAISIVSENPYCLARDIEGIGFKTADAIAQKLGISKDSFIRARAGIHSVLTERVDEGHVAFPRQKLIAEASVRLEIDEGRLQEATELEIGENTLVQEKIDDQECLYPTWLYKCEVEVAKRLADLLNGKPPWGNVKLERALEWAEDRMALALDSLQKEAVKTSLTSKSLVITGGPGTGKTTITRAIVSILKIKKVQMALCCPTGRAAKRLSECTGMEAKTIHRLLGYGGPGKGFVHGRENPLDCSMLIMDETSMVDLPLMRHVLRALPSHAALLLIGDVDQIPSVGPGCVLRTIIDSGAVPVVRLTQIFRQAAESQIVSNAHRINQGFLPDLKPQNENGDFYFISSNDPRKMIALIRELVKNRIPARFLLDAMTDIQVLSPMNRGCLGVRALNIELQKLLNPNSQISPRPSIERFGSTYAPGDKVMVTVNEYEKEVFNGDIGFITKIDLEKQEVSVDFDGRLVVFSFQEMEILSLAYAVTIHKSQGSEYPAVVIPLSMQHYMMLKRNLLYTAVTRGRKLVIVIGERRALETAIRAGRETRRWNKLAIRIREACNRSV